MEIGRLRHRVTIQRNTPSRDTYGSEIAAWGTLATVWAAVEPLQGREYWSAQQVQSAITTRIRIRKRADVTPLMRVLWDSRYFDIESVVHDPTNARETHLLCREVQDA